MFNNQFYQSSYLKNPGLSLHSTEAGQILHDKQIHLEKIKCFKQSCENHAKYFEKIANTSSSKNFYDKQA